MLADPQGAFRSRWQTLRVSPSTQKLAFMRITRPLLQSGALLAALSLGFTACGSEESKKGESDEKPTALAACDDADSGKTSEAVKVTGDFGKEQKATFEAPLKGTAMQRTVLDEGDGDEVGDGAKVNVLLTVLSGKTGKSLGSQSAEFPAGDTQIPEAFRAGVECAPIGSRSVVTVPAEDVYGAEGNAAAGITADDTMVIVTDVIDVVKPLKPAEWEDAPEVTFDESGKPTVELEGEPAKELMLEVLEEGDGKVVEETSDVELDYQGTSWDTKQVFDESYGKQPLAGKANGFVPGFNAAILGQKAGSKLLVTIPPEHAYGPKEGGHQLGGQTLVFVIEVVKVS